MKFTKVDIYKGLELESSRSGKVEISKGGPLERLTSERVEIRKHRGMKRSRSGKFYFQKTIIRESLQLVPFKTIWIESDCNSNQDLERSRIGTFKIWKVRDWGR